MADRREQLQAMLVKQPNDAFLHFALAMECAKLGDADAALAEFDRVIELDPSYTAAYTQKALLCEKLNRLDDAKATYRRGIESAKARGDHHAVSKMQEVLDRLVRTTGE
ncbi:MAG: tetratricopeptide repeat protein [Phycisphaerae bacterium]|nr:tetratricopeptide repeat protein [Phycisphaerae bacterium]